jgi:DNA-binding transcriptional regulator YiaG
MRKQPSEKTIWAYWMQAIESKSNAINNAFPGFHPQFVVQSQREAVSPEMFVFRRLQLRMNVAQCAAYLCINEKTLRRWENGHQEIPFMAYELLRVLSENLFARMSHKAWDGWFISTEGKLVSPNIGRCEYTPEQLEWISWQGTEAARLQREVNHLQKALGEAQVENTKLRQMFLSQGVVDELYSMHDRLSELVEKMATARIVPFKKSDQAEPMEKTA